MVYLNRTSQLRDWKLSLSFKAVIRVSLGSMMRSPASLVSSKARHWLETPSYIVPKVWLVFWVFWVRWVSAVWAVRRVCPVRAESPVRVVRPVRAVMRVRPLPRLVRLCREEGFEMPCRAAFFNVFPAAKGQYAPTRGSETSDPARAGYSRGLLRHPVP